MGTRYSLEDHRFEMKERREKQNSWEASLAEYVTPEYIKWLNKQPKYKRKKD